jgi:hypothetical protein
MPAYLVARSTSMVREVKANVRPAVAAGEYIKAAHATRFERADGRVSAAPPRPKSPYEILVSAVCGKTDGEIDAFASSIGGYGSLCGMVLKGLRPTIGAQQDATVGFVFGEDLGWVVRSEGGTVSVTKREPKGAPATVRSSAPDFLRVITRDVSLVDALATGSVAIEGDADLVPLMLGVAP